MRRVSSAGEGSARAGATGATRVAETIATARAGSRFRMDDKCDGSSSLLPTSHRGGAEAPAAPDRAVRADGVEWADPDKVTRGRSDPQGKSWRLLPKGCT